MKKILLMLLFIGLSSNCLALTWFEDEVTVEAMPNSKETERKEGAYLGESESAMRYGKKCPADNPYC